MMADDPLTETLDPKSKLVGRAQGIYALSGQQELGLLMSFSYSFVDEPYNGSTFSLVGKNPVMNPVREMPVVGGTGLFRMARGYAIAKTHWFDITTGDAIVGYPCSLNLQFYICNKSLYGSIIDLSYYMYCNKSLYGSIIDLSNLV